MFCGVIKRLAPLGMIVLIKVIGLLFFDLIVIFYGYDLYVSLNLLFREKMFIIKVLDLHFWPFTLGQILFIMIYREMEYDLLYFEPFFDVLWAFANTSVI